MTCAVDAVAWGEKNRVALATGRTHEWVLARTQRDGPTQDSVRTTTRAVLAKWFDGFALDVLFADASDAVDDVQVTDVSTVRPTPNVADQRREQLDPLPTLASNDKGPLYVSVQFNYRGYAKSMPWPVWTSSIVPLRSAKDCPFDADWMLVQSKSIDALPIAPDRKDPLDRLSENAPGAIGDVATLVKYAGWGLGAWLALQVVMTLKKAS